MVDAPDDQERRAVMSLLVAMMAAAVVLATAWRTRPPRRMIALAAGPDERRRTRVGGSLVRPAARRLGGVATITTVCVACFIAFGPLAVTVAAAALGVVLRQRRRRANQRPAQTRAASLPAAVDLLVVALAAGLTPRHGVRLVADRGPPPLRAAFTDVVARMDAGEPLALAMPRLVVSVGEAARGLVRAIVVADRDGVPLRALLTRLADDSRRERRHHLEAAIRRLPVRLAFPLVSCTLPAFVVLTVVPVVGAGLHRLGPLGP